MPHPLDSFGEKFFGGFYGDLKYYGNKAVNALCCLICCGPLFILIGIILMASAIGNTDRVDRITAWNKVAADWNGGLAEDFAKHSAFTLQTTLGASSGVHILDAVGAASGQTSGCSPGYRLDGSECRLIDTDCYTCMTRARNKTTGGKKWCKYDDTTDDPFCVDDLTEDCDLSNVGDDLGESVIFGAGTAANASSCPLNATRRRRSLLDALSSPRTLPAQKAAPHGRVLQGHVGNPVGFTLTQDLKNDEINTKASSDENDPVITQVDKSFFYKAALARTQSFKNKLESDPDNWARKTVKVTVGGGSITNPKTIEVQPVKIHEEKYAWWGDKGSSNFQPGNIECTIPTNKISTSVDPSFSYPGTRFSSKRECPLWCESMGGVWDKAKDANNQCYLAKTDLNSCCNTRWGLEKVCLQVKCKSKDKCEIGDDLAGCDYGPSPFDYEKATTALKSDSFKFGVTKNERGAMIGTDTMHGFQYAKMDKSDKSTASRPTFDDWDVSKKIDVILRSSEDPSIFLSKESKGCNTGKWKKDVTFTEKASLKVQDDSGKSPCFGLTPAQQAAVGLVFLILGCVGLIPPCVMVYMIKKMVADKKSKGEFTAP